MHAVTVRHSFDTAHRHSPHLAAACRSLHGHSWTVEITLAAPAWSRDLATVEPGRFKRAARNWIDLHLDGGAMLGTGDPLLPALRGDDCKVFTFGPGGDWSRAPWPTAEAVAALLADRAEGWAAGCAVSGAYIARVAVADTRDSGAEWFPATRPGPEVIVNLPPSSATMGPFTHRMKGPMP